MGTAEEREARLDALGKATVEWVDRRTKELTENVGTVKKLLQRRAGSERLASTTGQAVSDLVVEAINDFLAP